MKKILAISSMLISFAFTQAALASGFHTGQSSASYMGQGQTGITFLDNAGLVAQNPAALVFLDQGTQTYGGLVHYDTEYSFNNLDGSNPATTTHGSTIAPQGYLAQTNKDWAWGTGLYTPFNSGVEWPDDWEGKDVLTRISLNVANIPLEYSRKINDNLALAAGINYIFANVELEQIVPVTATEEVPADISGQDSSTTGFNLAMFYASGNLNFGATYNSGYSLKAEGEADFDTSSSPTGEALGLFPDGDATIELNIPTIVEAAVSYKSFMDGGDGYQRGAWAVEFGATYTTWSDYDEIVIDYEEDLPQSESTTTTDWFDVTDYKIGGFYSFRDNMKLRAGYYKTASPIPEEYLSPSTPDGEGRNTYYAGFGYKTGNVVFDAAYLRSFFTDSKTETHSELPGEYNDGNAHVIALGFGYRLN